MPAWTDTPARYGLVTRLLHWAVALLLAWQLGGMVVKALLGRHAVTAFLVGTHKPIGTVLMLLIALRALWALLQWRQRPAHPPGWIGHAACAGHALLYVLMLAIPALALLREFGGTRAFAPWGVPLFGGRSEEISALVAAGDAAHGTLGWLLLAVIVGHVAMVAVHHFFWRDGTLRKLTGPLRD